MFLLFYRVNDLLGDCLYSVYNNSSSKPRHFCLPFILQEGLITGLLIFFHSESQLFESFSVNKAVNISGFMQY
jgi:hypothetical protein